ncbi:MAG: pyruvate ferredoxin oxidoreductase [Candidatus Hydrothermarchaeota archaeon]
MIKPLTGNYAVAEAVKLCDVDVIAAYPITPSTQMVERISEMVANGEIDAEFIPVESEHSAMSACIGASSTGARVFTGTASQGLALMHEMLFVASGMRLPIVMGVGNRALSAPLSIWCDHNDTLAQRDSGWIQFYAENSQEALDLIFIAYRTAEHHEVQLPAMVCLDGFILTHTVDRVNVPEKELVDSFLPPRDPIYTVNPEVPTTMGAYAFPSHYFEFRRQQEEGMRNAKKLLPEFTKEFLKIFERKYGFFEILNPEAETFFFAMGSSCTTMKGLIQGKDDLGLLKLTVFRPFPYEELEKALKSAERVIVVDRDIAPGAQGAILYGEVRNALYETGVDVINVITGLGGRDIRPDILEKALKLEKGVHFLGLRE